MKQEIFSPKRLYVALSPDSNKGYIVCLVDKTEQGETIDTDYQIGWISNSLHDEGFYLADVNVNNTKIDLLDLHELLKMCVFQTSTPCNTQK